MYDNIMTYNIRNILNVWFYIIIGGNNMEREKILEDISKIIIKDRGGCSKISSKELDDGSMVLSCVSTEKDNASRISRIGRDIIIINGDDYTQFSTYPTSYEISGNACRLNVYRGKVGEEEPSKMDKFIMVSEKVENEVLAMINALRTSSPELAAQLMKCAGYGEITNKESKKI